MKQHWLLGIGFRRRPRIYADHSLLGNVALLTGTTYEGNPQLITHETYSIWHVTLNWQQFFQHYDFDPTGSPLASAKALFNFHRTMKAGPKPIPELLEQVITNPPRLLKEKNMGTTACVYYDFNHRSCLALSRCDGQVICIPATSEGYDVAVWDEKNFDTVYNTCLPDYPPERCAKVYVEFAQFLGATPAALHELGRLTTITESEYTMATKKATPITKPAATKPAAPAKKPAKTPKAFEAKAPKAIKVVVAKEPKTTEAKAPKAEGGEKKGSAAALFRELIMAGKLTDSQIFEQVQAKFGLTPDKKGHVSWYRNWLKRNDQNPPARVAE